MPLWISINIHTMSCWFVFQVFPRNSHNRWRLQNCQIGNSQKLAKINMSCLNWFLWHMLQHFVYSYWFLVCFKFFLRLGILCSLALSLSDVFCRLVYYSLLVRHSSCCINHGRDDCSIAKEVSCILSESTAAVIYTVVWRQGNSSELVRRMMATYTGQR